MYSEYRRKPFNAAMGKEADERNLEMEQRGNAANDDREVGEQDNGAAEARMAEEVCALLTQHADLDARDIQVIVHSGEVWLEGTVNTEPSKRLAGDILKTAFGMTVVHNNLQVREEGTGRF